MLAVRSASFRQAQNTPPVDNSNKHETLYLIRNPFVLGQPASLVSGSREPECLDEARDDPGGRVAWLRRHKLIWSDQPPLKCGEMSV